MNSWIWKFIMRSSGCRLVQSQRPMELQNLELKWWWQFLVQRLIFSLMSISVTQGSVLFVTSYDSLSSSSVNSIEFRIPGYCGSLYMYNFNRFYEKVQEISYSSFTYTTVHLGSQNYNCCWWKLRSRKLCNVWACIQP